MDSNKNGTKHLLIEEHLLRGIASRRFKQALPSENDLAKRFGVSRMTARRALSTLVRNGFAYRIPRKGTFVQKQRLVQGFFNIPSHRSLAEKLGATYRIEVLQRALSPAPEEVSARLGTSNTILVRRIHFIDDKPVSYEKRYLCAEVCNDIVWENLETESILEILINKLEIPATTVWQRVEAIVLSEEDAAYFDVRIGLPAFCLERVLYSLERPICRTTYIMRGDVFAFEDVFSPQSPDRSAAGQPPALPDRHAGMPSA